MRKRKKEIALKRKTGVINSLICGFYTVKAFIFPDKMQFCINGNIRVSPAMSSRQIRAVAFKICKTAFLDAKYRSY